MSTTAGDTVINENRFFYDSQSVASIEVCYSSTDKIISYIRFSYLDSDVVIKSTGWGIKAND